jgi:hypothetical protein
MDKHIINDILIILRKGGIKQLPENDGNESRNISKLLSIVESWLGVLTVDGSDDNNDNDNGMVMMEDAAPFDDDFYRSLEDFLI